MHFRLFPEKGTTRNRAQPSAWLEAGILIILAAAILRLGGDLASQWQLTAERIGLVEADLHAKDKADYSVDPLDAIIPPISPAILEVFGLLRPPWEADGNSSGGSPDLPLSPPGGTQAKPETTLPLTPTTFVPGHTGLPTHTVTPTATLPGEALFTPTPTSSQAIILSATPTRTLIVTPTHSLTPWVSPTRTPIPTRTPTPTPAKTITPTRIIPTPVDPTKTPTPTPNPPTETKAPSITPTKTTAPNTSTPTKTTAPDTSTPTPKTPTPFVTRDPTRALTPTGNYTPGGTSAPTTPEPPDKAAGEVTNCMQLPSGMLSGDGCVPESIEIVNSTGRSFWQVLLDFFGVDFRRGVDFWVTGQ